MSIQEAQSSTRKDTVRFLHVANCRDDVNLDSNSLCLYRGLSHIVYDESCPSLYLNLDCLDNLEFCVFQGYYDMLPTFISGGNKMLKSLALEVSDEVDVSGLSGLTNLEYLFIGIRNDRQSKELCQIEYDSLVYFYLRYENITDFSVLNRFLRRNPYIKSFGLDAGRAVDIRQLELGHKVVERLDINIGLFNTDNIRVLESMTSLKVLDIVISDIHGYDSLPFEKLRHLEVLNIYIENTNLSDEKIIGFKGKLNEIFKGHTRIALYH
ncbi:hypothetical protein [Croceimicrobium hydrocarbonivorans]|uniref:Uncharacterized protein n=1 Tax=Croceimicrobium hydrocarbonivorans TaxID=2761580 RepID=A0A7H0VBW4_9FLAO|nr:hypothetical protein [Croceimicrobium hydrocarbonivorans]QNR23212.1 hypothetical protein H4K34_12610 [Croceimicrobium hydrocarbonivorans]